MYKVSGHAEPGEQHGGNDQANLLLAAHGGLLPCNTAGSREEFRPPTPKKFAF
jgi:hypothetical protein